MFSNLFFGKTEEHGAWPTTGRNEEAGTNLKIIAAKTEFPECSSDVGETFFDDSVEPLVDRWIVLGPNLGGDCKPIQAMIHDRFQDGFQSFQRRHLGDLRVAADDLGKLLVPEIEDLVEEVVAIVEMPVETTLGDPNLAGQAFDPDTGHAFFFQHFKRLFEPLGFGDTFLFHRGNISPSFPGSSSMARGDRSCDIFSSEE